MRASAALRAAVFQLAMRAGVAVHAAVFRLPCGQPTQSTQSPFTLPCGQGLQSAQLYFHLPCGQPVQSTQLCFTLSCEHRLRSLPMSLYRRLLRGEARGLLSRHGRPRPRVVSPRKHPPGGKSSGAPKSSSSVVSMCRRWRTFSWRTRRPRSRGRDRSRFGYDAPRRRASAVASVPSAMDARPPPGRVGG
jgi:hypothetical protein